MGTSNFHSNRTSCIFAIEDSQDEFIYEDTIDNIRYSLKAIDENKSNDWEFIYDKEIRLNENLHSFPASSIGWFQTHFSYAGVNIKIMFVPKSVSGYYSGFNLDFEMQFCDDYSSEHYVYDAGDEQGMVETILNEHLYQNPQLSGIIKIHGKDILSKLQEKIQEGQNLLENVFKMYSDEYKIAAQFSNGETIYTKCKEIA